MLREGYRIVAHIIQDGSLRNRAVAKRDRRAEPRGRKAYLKQYVDRPNGEPACLDAGLPRPGLSQRRIGDWSRRAALKMPPLLGRRLEDNPMT
jgi:hypothetical protein